MVPISGNVICICHTTNSGKPTYFTIAYDGPDFKPCGIAFEFSAVNFSCAMDGLIRVKALGDIYFRKIYVGMATSATLSMYVGMWYMLYYKSSIRRVAMQENLSFAICKLLLANSHNYERTYTI